VFVALGILNAMRNIFKHYLINGTIFEKKDIEHKMCLHFRYNFCRKHFFHSKKNWARFGHKYLL